MSGTALHTDRGIHYLRQCVGLLHCIAFKLKEHLPLRLHSSPTPTLSQEKKGGGKEREEERE